ncbi:exonuclease domain-containing protein [Subtercola boreus]|uniref:exonuclease domain-containing protein n=1 Tax=Subtercola boreus TaxID=120213 RepID=UPI001558A206|nr:exonuclease domain-containing protein [Subtercola boreus]
MPKPSQGFAVIDFETTGLAPEYHHRVIEIAVVHVDPHGAIEGTWQTLVNPMRDLGPTHIHGVRGADARQAPLFEQVAAQFVELLAGRVLVAHNASFEARFLRAELARIDAASPVANDHALCTMRLAREFLPGAGRSLADCCAAYDIELVNAHEAAVDAFATAELLARYLDDNPGHPLWKQYESHAARHLWPTLSAPPARAPWHPRSHDTDAPNARSFLGTTMALLPAVDIDPRANPSQQDYLALLDEALADGFLSLSEADALHDMAAALGIDAFTRERLHQRYFDDLVTVAWADGILTDDEIADIAQVALLLDIPDKAVTDALNEPARKTEPAPRQPDHVGKHSGSAETDVIQLAPGDLVVLTGEMPEPRSYYEDKLAAAGLVPWTAVTKKVKLVVAADPDSLSGKARKAHDYGIPIVGIDHLLGLL